MPLRLLIIVLLLSSAIDLSARGRARGYQAGGGVHRAQAKARVRQPKVKQPRKPSPPPEAKLNH